MSKLRNERKLPSKAPPEAPAAVPKQKALAVRSTRASTHRKQRRTVDGDARRSMIAEAAYFRAERRNFADGGAFDDWIEAENQIDRLLDLDSER